MVLALGVLRENGFAERTSQYWFSESSVFGLLLGFVSFTLAALVFLLLGASSTKPPSASYSSLAARLRESCFDIVDGG